jgi:glycosyltransferase involved in cell wall biosynthesis
MSSELHLLIVDTTLGHQLAGGGYHILRVSKEWEKHISVTMFASKIFASSNSSLTPNEVHIKDPIPNVESNDPKLYTIIGMIRAFFIMFSRISDRYDVIVVPSHYAFHVLPCMFLKLRRRGTRVVVYFHDILITTDNPMRTMLSTAHNLIGFFLVRLSADLIFAINESAKKRCLEFGIKAEKIVMMSNAVDVTNLVRDISPKKTIEFDACFLGRLVKTKGVYDLLHAWKIICCKEPNAKLAIIGDGPEKEGINKLVKRIGIEHNVTLFGFVSEDEKYRILTNSKVYVFPSYLESWGIAVAEAMACGLPVVAYGLPAYKEVFEDKLVTVPLGDVDDLVKRVEFLLENPEAAREIGAKGREFIKRYDWNVVAERELSEIIALRARTYGR